MEEEPWREMILKEGGMRHIAEMLNGYRVVCAHLKQTLSEVCSVRKQWAWDALFRRFNNNALLGRYEASNEDFGR